MELLDHANATSSARVWATFGPQTLAKSWKRLKNQELRWRRRRDSNPGYRFWPVCSLSRGVPSTTRPRLRCRTFNYNRPAARPPFLATSVVMAARQSSLCRHVPDATESSPLGEALAFRVTVPVTA